MNMEVKPPAVTRVVPPEIASLLGRPPLLRTENREAYWCMLERIAAELNPQGILEWQMIKNYTDCVWEMNRLQSTKTHIVNIGQKDALFSIVHALSDEQDHEMTAADAVRSWSKDEANKQVVLQELAKHELDDRSIMDQAFVQRIDLVEKIERIYTRTDARRRTILRDLELHRESSLWGGHRTTPEMIEGKADTIPLVPQQKD